MKKENIKLKENITLEDQITVIEIVTHSLFTVDRSFGDLKYMKYTPYYYEHALMYALGMNFVDGITIEDGDEETLYETIIGDEEIMKVAIEASKMPEVQFIRDQIAEIMSFKKEEVMRNNSSIFKSLVDSDAEIKRKHIELINENIKKTKSENELLQKQSKYYDYMDEFNSKFSPEELANIVKKLDSEGMSIGDITQKTVEKYISETQNKPARRNKSSKYREKQ